MRSHTLTMFFTVIGVALGAWLANAATTPMSTRDFVAMCDTSVASTKCLLEFQIVDAANDWMDDPKSKNCAPISDVGDQTFGKERASIKRVVVWLKQHPELMDQSDTNSVGRALRTLYPCS